MSRPPPTAVATLDRRCRYSNIATTLNEVAASPCRDCLARTDDAAAGPGACLQHGPAAGHDAGPVLRQCGACDGGVPGGVQLLGQRHASLRATAAAHPLRRADSVVVLVGISVLPLWTFACMLLVRGRARWPAPSTHTQPRPRPARSCTARFRPCSALTRLPDCVVLVRARDQGASSRCAECRRRSQRTIRGQALLRTGTLLHGRAPLQGALVVGCWLCLH